MGPLTVMSSLGCIVRAAAMNDGGKNPADGSEGGVNTKGGGKKPAPKKPAPEARRPVIGDKRSGDKRFLIDPRWDTGTGSEYRGPEIKDTGKTDTNGQDWKRIYNGGQTSEMNIVMLALGVVMLVGGVVSGGATSFASFLFLGPPTVPDKNQISIYEQFILKTMDQNEDI